MKIFKLSEMDQIDVNAVFEDLVVIPTETVYGLAARIDNEEACKNIFKIKGRPSDNPLIVHVSDISMLKPLIDGEIPEEYLPLIEKYWPGPLTLIFKVNKTVSKVVTGIAHETIAVRMPKNEKLRNVIARLGCSLAAPSANTSGKPSPTTVEHVIRDLGNKVNYYIDDGPCDVGLESTIFGIIDNKYLILRPGGVTKEQLEETLKTEIQIKNKVTSNEKIICPGQKYKHYSPNIPVYLFKGVNWHVNMQKRYEEDKNKKIGLLKRRNIKYPINECTEYDMGSTLSDFSRELFAGLRKLDEECDLIYVLEVELDGEGLAIMDRLEKASTNHVI